MSVSGYDASTPPSTPPKVEVVEIYVGGDTPHVWTDQQIAAQTAPLGLPVWVRSNPPGPGARSDAAGIVAAFVSHHWPLEDKAVMIDMETAVDPTYLDQLAAILHAHGMRVLVYGSQSTIDQNPVVDGRVDAAPGSADTVTPGDVGTQWSWQHTYDLDVFAPEVIPWLIDIHPIGVPVETTSKTVVATPIAVIAANATGYWIVTDTAEVHSFGDAPRLARTGSQPDLPGPWVAAGVTADRRGIWLVNREGSVLRFGDAPFYGSLLS